MVVTSSLRDAALVAVTRECFTNCLDGTSSLGDERWFGLMEAGLVRRERDDDVAIFSVKNQENRAS
jgi:hypothetical protein